MTSTPLRERFADGLPTNLLRGHWSIPEIEGVVNLAKKNPPPRFVPAYRAWAEANGYQNRRLRTIIATLEKLGIKVPCFSTRWTKAEIASLASHMEDYPPALIACPFSHWALTAGYAPRTQAAIMQAAAEHLNCHDWRPSGHWIHQEDLADLLKIPLNTVRQWIYGQHVRSHREPTGDFYLHRGSFEYLARHRPEILAVGLTRTGLLGLLSKAYLADRVLAAHPAPPPPPPPLKPVQLLTNCRWWPSAAHAAEELGIPEEDIEASAQIGSPTPAGPFRYCSVPSRHLQLKAGWTPT